VNSRSKGLNRTPLASFFSMRDTKRDTLAISFASCVTMCIRSLWETLHLGRAHFHRKKSNACVGL
jgi:hypothetical protein